MPLFFESRQLSVELVAQGSKGSEGLTHCLRRVDKSMINLTNSNPGMVYRFFGKPSFLRFSRSPSASHLLALTSCTTLIICLPDMIGKDTPAMTHGHHESILLARASSSAPALYGLGNMLRSDGYAGDPGCADCGASPSGLRREGDSVGEEKERR